MRRSLRRVTIGSGILNLSPTSYISLGNDRGILTHRLNSPAPASLTHPALLSGRRFSSYICSIPVVSAPTPLKSKVAPSFSTSSSLQTQPSSPNTAQQSTATAYIFEGVGRPIRTETLSVRSLVESLPPDDVLVKIDVSTICGSDLHTISGLRNEPTPLVLGHEGVGTIVAFGSRRSRTETRLQVGDRVTWSIADSCGKCNPCAHYSIPQKCSSLFKYGHSKWDATNIVPSSSSSPSFSSSTTSSRSPSSPTNTTTNTNPIASGFSGTYASHIILRSGTFICPLPEDLPSRYAAPANCALATVVGALTPERIASIAPNPDRSRAVSCTRDTVSARLPRPPRTALVQGAGLLGLYAVMLLKHRYSFDTVICVDPHPGRLAIAKAFGATPILAGLTEVKPKVKIEEEEEKHEYADDDDDDYGDRSERRGSDQRYQRVTPNNNNNSNNNNNNNNITQSLTDTTNSSIDTTPTNSGINSNAPTTHHGSATQHQDQQEQGPSGSTPSGTKVVHSNPLGPYDTAPARMPSYLPSAPKVPHVVLESMNSERRLKEVRSIAPDGVDLAVEVAGVPEVVGEGVQSLRYGGMYVMLGLVHPHSALSVTGETLIRKCATVVANHNYAPADLKQAIEFLKEHKHLPFDLLVSPPRPISQINMAVEEASLKSWPRVSLQVD